MYAIQEHLLHMIQFRFAVSRRIIDPIINDPKLIQFRIDIHTSHDPDAFDNAMRISTVLPPHQLNVVREVLVRHRIIKDQKPFWRLNNLVLNTLPSQLGTQFISIQIAVEGIMTKPLAVLGKIRQGVVDLTDQQILAIIQATDCLSSSSHTLKLIRFSRVLKSLSFA